MIQERVLDMLIKSVIENGKFGYTMRKQLLTLIFPIIKDST